MRKKKKKLLLSFFLLIALISGALCYWYITRPNVVIQPGDGFPEITNAKRMPSEKLKEYAKKEVDKTSVTINVYPEVKIDADGVNGTWWVQNLPINIYGQEVKLMDDNTGEILYKSGLIEPGFQIDKVKLNKKLEQGTYKATGKLSFYDLKSKKLQGTTAVSVTILVS